MELSEQIRQVFSYADQHQEEHINRLREAVAIRSVSQQKEFRNETIRVVNHFKTVCYITIRENLICFN